MYWEFESKQSKDIYLGSSMINVSGQDYKMDFYYLDRRITDLAVIYGAGQYGMLYYSNCSGHYRNDIYWLYGLKLIKEKGLEMNELGCNNLGTNK